MGKRFDKKDFIKEINEKMKDFYLSCLEVRSVIPCVEEFFLSNELSYFQYWKMVKLLGVHLDIEFQNRFWNLNYHSASIQGIFLFFVLLSKDLHPNTSISTLKRYFKLVLSNFREEGHRMQADYNDFVSILVSYFKCTILNPYKVLKTSLEIENELDMYYNDQILMKFVQFILSSFMVTDQLIDVDRFLAVWNFDLRRDGRLRQLFHKYVTKEIVEKYKSFKKLQNKEQLIKI